MESKPENKPSHATTLVVVLGMHRSGTSVITRAMEVMGAEFGAENAIFVGGLEGDRRFVWSAPPGCRMNSEAGT